MLPGRWLPLAQRTEKGCLQKETVHIEKEKAREAHNLKRKRVNRDRAGRKEVRVLILENKQGENRPGLSCVKHLFLAYSN